MISEIKDLIKSAINPVSGKPESEECRVKDVFEATLVILKQFCFYLNHLYSHVWPDHILKIQMPHGKQWNCMKTKHSILNFRTSAFIKSTFHLNIHSKHGGSQEAVTINVCSDSMRMHMRALRGKTWRVGRFRPTDISFKWASLLTQSFQNYPINWIHKEKSGKRIEARLKHHNTNTYNRWLLWNIMQENKVNRKEIIKKGKNSR